jgi:16S rRNA (guanine1207-N2)-methyltransferase
MSRRRDLLWRDHASAALAVACLQRLDVDGPLLTMQDPLPDVEVALRSSGADVTAFHRRAFGGRDASTWPSPGPYQGVTLRIPRGKEELSMSLSAACSVLRKAGWLLVYGARDEGIQAAQKPLSVLFSRVETMAVGGRCRVLRGSGLRSEFPDRPCLEDWKVIASPGHPELPGEWVSYPGVFAHGRLDEGTRLLLGALPGLPAEARLLDYGCGTGVVGYVASKRGKKLQVDLLDVDAVALEAASQNFPEASLLLHDGLPPVGSGPYDAILSNPPFHRGKAEDPGMILSLISGSGALLSRDGSLVLVAQKRLALEADLSRHFKDVEALSDDRTFRVWRGRDARRLSPRRL